MTIDTNEIDIGSGELLRQAMMTAHDYMHSAERDVNELFTAEYCKRNPEFRARMIAAHMTAAATDFNTALMKIGAQNIRDGLRSVADALAEDCQ